MTRIYLVLVTGALLLIPALSHACSMYKITRDSKTIVGNNEDWLSPNAQFWYEQGSEGQYGAMYMGFLNNFIQGGFNEAGLVFDGFYELYLSVDTVGKLNIPIGDALRHVMQTMQTVEEVKDYLGKVNLNILQTGQLVFVDRTGTYLIVEGDLMYIGNEEEKTFSNFYYSQTQSLDEVEIPFYQKGRSFINQTEGTGTKDYCSQAMQSFAQSSIASTQYTTVYDLNELTVRVFLFGDYSEPVEIDLKEELKKANHKYMVAELFPEGSLGFQHYAKYNNPDHPARLLEELIGNQQITEEELVSNGFVYIISERGYEWLEEIKNAKGAIKVYEYGISLMPNQAVLYADLADAYLADDDKEKALQSLLNARKLAINDEELLKRILIKQRKKSTLIN